MLKKEEMHGLRVFPKGLGLVGIVLIRQGDTLGGTWKESFEFYQGQKCFFL
jgi:hypothetical protein